MAAHQLRDHRNCRVSFFLREQCDCVKQARGLSTGLASNQIGELAFPFPKTSASDGGSRRLNNGWSFGARFAVRLRPCQELSDRAPGTRIGWRQIDRPCEGLQGRRTLSQQFESKTKFKLREGRIRFRRNYKFQDRPCRTSVALPSQRRTQHRQRIGTLWLLLQCLARLGLGEPWIRCQKLSDLRRTDNGLTGGIRVLALRQSVSCSSAPHEQADAINVPKKIHRGRTRQPR